jgi:hypothetical protein
MKVRELLTNLLGYTADGRTLDEEVLLRVDEAGRSIESSYTNGTFILIAGPRVDEP